MQISLSLKILNLIVQLGLPDYVILLFSAKDTDLEADRDWAKEILTRICTKLAPLNKFPIKSVSLWIDPFII